MKAMDEKQISMVERLLRARAYGKEVLKIYDEAHSIQDASDPDED